MYSDNNLSSNYRIVCIYTYQVLFILYIYTSYGVYITKKKKKKKKNNSIMRLKSLPHI